MAAAVIKATRPALRWHGGKWLLAPWIISHFPPHRVYVEPFGGAASVLIQKPQSYAEIYNDLDDDVVNLFRILRCPLKSTILIERLRKTPFSRTEFNASYAQHECPIDYARAIVVRTFMGFGTNAHMRATGFRANSNRSGTTPARDWANHADALVAIAERFRGVVVENRDALKVMAQHDGIETLHYIDPPYHPDTRDGGHDYNHELTNADHGALLEFAKSLAGYVIISGYPHRSYDMALKGWERIARKAFADGARERTEVLWINPRASAKRLERMPMLPMFRMETSNGALSKDAK